MSRYVSPTHSVPVVLIEKGLYNMRQFVISLPSVADRGVLFAIGTRYGPACRPARLLAMSTFIGSPSGWHKV